MLYYHTNSYVAKDDMGGIGDADAFGNFAFVDATLTDWREINAKEEQISTDLEKKNAKDE
jgi:hypothetical protein